MSILFVSTVYGKISIKERDWKIFRKTGFEYKLYFILKDYMSFDQAEGYCRNKNAHLVSIHSDEENQFVNRKLQKFEWSHELRWSLAQKCQETGMFSLATLNNKCNFLFARGRHKVTSREEKL
ncbi:hypothetical protein ANCCEY_13254 [Ancylostoma ceylanicum]|uniref:C-type lectin domain-containing protein n=1 Tax=Ancylostoma ceylanicum TaxID=53326 RepID=A0A0D6LJ49_9BILA|nr:hypothetical protein ANCCEY_13254 [Ancylostoma ceylanicum]